MNTDQQSQATPPSAPQSSPQAASGLSKDSLNMGMLCHLLALSGLVTGGLGFVVGPLIIWLIKKDSDPYVDEQGKESVNFQISMAIYGIVSALLLFVGIGFLLLPVVIIGNIVLTIIGSIKASKGEPWKYPVTIRLIK
jgi:uncharacterized protein